ncbi:TetR/AcrR family transcriptional regulator [Vibrio tapetis]|uniref:Putative TetR-family transcriptional regulator n=1 Tax=Vibrio tapetis subsp. tapetis TaxID=1671868 RepID=A0A2N8ZL39_9VIBR|nr:TetR/AcrR family transcriptional regulator [Vibrio tapetis]SON52586.1 putative TetR-family transcriptional regulator [Vibrio tapetis subsp. tapetis]
MNWQRARTDETKHQRREAITQAAFTLFKQNGYDGVSFNNIAAEAGFTKSNMYRYFSSKDEIFLSIFAELFNDWFTDCMTSLKTLTTNAEPETFASHWVNTLVAHPRFLDLTPLMFTSLEKNSAYDQLLEFKRLSMALLFQLAEEITRIYPKIAGEKAFKFLTLSYADTANSWAAGSHNEALLKIYQLEEFQALRPDFKRDLTSSIEVIIKGLTAD